MSDFYLNQPINIIAYSERGSEYPKNSIAALKASLALGAKHIMLDMQACGSGELVVYDHLMLQIDEKLQYVKYLSLSELAKHDLGSGQRIMTLSDVFAFLPDHISLTLRLIGRHSLIPILHFFSTFPARASPICFMSGDQLMLHSLSFRLPNIRCVAMIGGLADQDLSSILKQGINIVALPSQEVCSIITHEARRLGMSVWCHGVNHNESYQHCAMMSVSHVISHEFRKLGKNHMAKDGSMVGVG